MCIKALRALLLTLCLAVFGDFQLGSSLHAQTQTWRRVSDGAAPSVSDTSECRVNARQQAEALFPVAPPPRVPQGSETYGEGRRYKTELSLYDQCMRQKGFEQK